jgi:Fe-S-cluster-containing dehydrogenase component
MENNVEIGIFYNKVYRIGPTPKFKGAHFPNVEMYFLPVMCQHCSDPECIKVCPTQASHKAANGTVQIDKSKCIGCKLCVKACPYGTRTYNADTKVVEKCTLCQQLTSQGKDPQCVSGCVGLARVYGDLDDPKSKVSKLLTASSKNVHNLPDKGNHPTFRYVLRNATWKG